MPQSETPENARNQKAIACRDDKVKHEPARLPQWLDQKSRRNIGYNDDGNDPAENKAKKCGKITSGYRAILRKLK